MPSESQASPAAHHTKLSSSMIERQELGPGSPSCEGLSQADEEASQATSVSVSLNTEAHRMVDNLLDSEAAENTDDECNLVVASDRRGPTLAPALELSSARKVGIDTTYGFDTTLDTSAFIGALQDYSVQKQPQGSPRPHLPSIYNSPFAPQAGETTPRSRPSTAKRMSPHSRQHSQHALAFPPQVTECRESADSSMQDPSSFANTQTPTTRNALLFHRNQAPPWNGEFRGFSHYGAIGEPIFRGNGDSGFIDDSEFRSSEVFVGSNWVYSGQSATEVLNLHTPPNGQGAG
jgi:hypothetical protein